MAEDPVLRSHLHHLLFNYVQTYLAIDYPQHIATELSRVSRFPLQTLSLVLSRDLKIFNAFTPAPEYSSNFVTAPIDPLNGYLASLGDQIPLPDERWQVTTETTEYLRRSIRALAFDRTPRTESCWNEELGEDVESFGELAILTASAMKQTPNFVGHSSSFPLLNTTSPVHLDGDEDLDSARLLQVSYCPGLALIYDLTLRQLKLPIESKMLKNVVSILKRARAPPDPHRVPLAVSGFLAEEEPSIPVMDALLSPPIFPFFIQADEKLVLSDVKQVTSLVGSPIKLQQSEDDRHDTEMEMRVIGGWNTLVVSPTSSGAATPSLASSSSQIDELAMFPFSPSPPDDHFHNAKFDAVEFPLKRNEIAAPALQTPSDTTAFLTRHLPAIAEENDMFDDGSELSVRRNSPTEDSIRGYATERSVDSLIGSIYRGQPDPYSIWMKSEFSEMNDLYMTMPDVPPPHSLHAHSQLPSSINELLQLLRPSSGDLPVKRVSGLRSLEMELTWRPFVWKGKPPTHESVLQVNFQMTEATPLPGVYQFQDDARHHDPLESAFPLLSAPPNREFDFILTAAEKRRVSDIHASATFPSDGIQPEFALASSPSHLDEVQGQSSSSLSASLDSFRVLSFPNDSSPSDTPVYYTQLNGSQPCALPLVSPNRVPAGYDGSSFSSSSLVSADDCPGKLALSHFLFMRQRTHSISCVASPNYPEPSSHSISRPRSIQVFDVPADIIDSSALTVSTYWTPPTEPHTYLASVELIQKRALIHCLSNLTRITLVERETLQGVDLALDPDNAVIFVQLVTLPMAHPALTDQLVKLSYLYPNILVVFEAFPASHAFSTVARSDMDGTVPYPFPPAVVKSVKQLKRGLAMVADRMDPGVSIKLVFPRSLEETSKLIRAFGDNVESQSSVSILWDRREWLPDDEVENERLLANETGINTFAAMLLLIHQSLPSLKRLDANSRAMRYNALIGKSRMVKVNSYFDCEVSPPSPWRDSDR